MAILNNQRVRSSNGGFHSHGGFQKWLVYNGKSTSKLKASISRVKLEMNDDTVDGCEILHQLIDGLSHYL